MSPSQDPALLSERMSLHTRLAHGLDWWCKPRWRALATWIVVVAIVGFVMYWFRFQTWMLFFGRRMWPRLANLIGFRLPWSCENFVENTNTYVLLFWIEPLVLRLNVLRGVAWLALRVGSMAAGVFIPSIMVNLLVIALLPMWALYGWRSRPWMVPMGIAVGFGFATFIYYLNFIPTGIHMVAIAEIPLAISLIYGTRLLRPEESAEINA